MTTENRKLHRHEVATRGRVALPNGFKFDMTVRDFSRRGARLSAKRFVVLPDHFTVEMYSPDERRLKRCEAQRRWQKGHALGVQFLSSSVETIV